MTRRTRALLALLLAALVATGLAAPAGAGEVVRLVVRSTAAAAVVGSPPVERIEQLGVEVFEVPAARVAALVQQLAAAGIHAEPDRTVRVAAVATDPAWVTQWGPQKLRAPQAWDVTTGDPSVVIAIVDSGVDAAHPDLAGAVLPGIDFVQDDADASDVHGHGTLVAGVAAARANNGLDTAGYCWTCAILPVRVLDDSGTGRATDTARGIVWAAEQGADVINLSVLTTDVADLVQNAVAFARSRGAVVVASAGNSSSSVPSEPASLPGVIGVAAVESSDAMYAWSNHGPWVDVAAPSCHAGLTRPTGSRQFCGTSSAAPAVAGVAGLLFAARPGLPGSAVETFLNTTAVPVGSWVASGRIDASAAVAAALAWVGPPSRPQSVAAVPAPGEVLVTWAPPASDGGTPVTGYTITAQPGGATVTAGPTTTSAVVPGLTNGTAYTFTVVAQNAAGTGDAATAPAAVTPVDVPEPPQQVAAVVAGAASATVTWTPGADGGSPVTGYVVEVSPGNLVVEVPAPASSAVLTLGDRTGSTITVTAVNAVGRSGPSAPAVVGFEVPRSTRLAGADRVATSVAVSSRVFESASTVVVARADAYADALAAGPLAARLGAPVLLSPTAALPAEVAAEVSRLGARQAVLVGGTSALAEQVERDLAGVGVTSMRRLAGSNRFDTARVIAAEVGGASIVLVEGAHADPTRGWPDAVAASAYAAATNRPILLVAGGVLPNETAAAARELGTSEVVVVGGTAAVPDGVARELALPWRRIAGANRYATSVAVAEAATAEGAIAARPWIATGRSWPDALTAGPAAAAAGGVLLLVDGADTGSATLASDWLRSKARHLEELVVVGGTGSVSEAAAAHLVPAAG